MNHLEMSPEELLRLEERQLRYFMTEVRPIGEEKSELYPEPQYFNLTMMSGAIRMPETIRKILARTGGPVEYANRIKRVLSYTSAVQLTGIQLIMAWGREMLRLESELAGVKGFVHERPELDDRSVASVMEFSHLVVSAYREDGQAYPSKSGAYGSDYSIIPRSAVELIIAKTVPVDAPAAREVLGLLAVIRALSFLMEAETRDALMMHGPYPVGDGNLSLVLFECSDLHWSLFENFSLPGGARWSLPNPAFPVANLAIALVLRDVSISADRFGTLYIEPLGPENVVAAALLSRGQDELRDDGLGEIPLKEAAPMRRRAGEIQNAMFLQIAGWDLRQRLTAGAQEEQMLQLRMLAAAGYDRSAIEAEQRSIMEFQDAIWPYYFERILNRAAGEVPFFQKMEAFAKGSAPRLFSPLHLR
jgi:hypothetical protein